jgi:hypothetical protein
VARRLLPYVANVGPPGIRRFLLTLLPSKKVQKIRYMVDVMHQTSITIFKSKKAALRQGDEAVLEQLGRDKDIMSILCMLTYLLPVVTVAHLIRSKSKHGSKRTGPPSGIRTYRSNDVRFRD